MGRSLGVGKGRWAGGNVDGLEVYLRARLDGTDRAPSWGIGVDRVEDGRVEGGCRDECRVEGVPTKRGGEGVAVVLDGVEVELEGLDGGGWAGNERLEYRQGRV